MDIEPIPQPVSPVPTPEQPNPSVSTPPPRSEDPNGKPKDTGMAILAYIGILVLIPLLTDAKNDPFVKFHVKQGLVLLISEIIAGFIYVVPYLGWFLGTILWLFNLVMVIMGIMAAASGQQKELPILGQFAKNFHF